MTTTMLIGFMLMFFCMLWLGHICFRRMDNFREETDELVRKSDNLHQRLVLLFGHLRKHTETVHGTERISDENTQAEPVQQKDDSGS